MGAWTPEGAKDITTVVSPNANSKDYDEACGPFPSYETFHSSDTLIAHCLTHDIAHSGIASYWVTDAGSAGRVLLKQTL